MIPATEKEDSWKRIIAPLNGLKKSSENLRTNPSIGWLLENKFSIIGLVCFLRSQVWTSSVLTAAMGTNWVTTLCLSTVHVGNLGSYVTVQLGYRSLTRSGSACFAFWLAGSCVMQSKQVETMQAAMAININPYQRTMLILFAIQLFHKQGREFWTHLESCSNSRNMCASSNGSILNTIVHCPW